MTTWSCLWCRLFIKVNTTCCQVPPLCAEPHHQQKVLLLIWVAQAGLAMRPHSALPEYWALCVARLCWALWAKSSGWRDYSGQVLYGLWTHSLRQLFDPGTFIFLLKGFVIGCGFLWLLRVSWQSFMPDWNNWGWMSTCECCWNRQNT